MKVVFYAGELKSYSAIRAKVQAHAGYTTGKPVNLILIFYPFFPNANYF
jgi:hypothetical protein